MKIDEFIQGITFNYCYPFENRLKNYSPAKELNNIKWPIDDISFRKKLKNIINIPKEVAYATGGIINKAVELMPKDSVYVCFGVGPCGFPWIVSMLGNKGKRCIGIDSIKKKILRPYYYIYAKEGHEYNHCTRTKQWKTLTDLFWTQCFDESLKLGVVFINTKKDVTHILNAVHEYIIKDGIIIINNINDYCNVYGAVQEFVGVFGEYRTIMINETPHSKHITYRGGIWIIQKT